MVDSCDVRRFEEAKDEIQELLDYDPINEKPIVVLSNKVDRSDATHLDDIIKALGLDDKALNSREALSKFLRLA